ncbi:hypothetical protein DFA_06713 [Cavenderia fasciculata]|uniref:Uncharacterized protein n=1 Tax=Cavenderia fasciculata TaxID=261658 RepID=F4Q226_CACFS|nr:uncharacterized protein DFA_06713 [Cavenderia fasciculata]EGG18046.1 hypothetical protein DFA_06713 [Cavenderia fasciculata]|eukprot:XP_004356939.1 hypothetical protein DFA_06713 [Cavenderia fasciculata]
MSLFASLSKIGSINNNTNSIKQSCSSSNNSMIISMNNGSSIQSENMNAFSKPFWGKCQNKQAVDSNINNNNTNDSTQPTSTTTAAATATAAGPTTRTGRGHNLVPRERGTNSRASQYIGRQQAPTTTEEKLLVPLDKVKELTCRLETGL